QLDRLRIARAGRGGCEHHSRCRLRRAWRRLLSAFGHGARRTPGRSHEPHGEAAPLNTTKQPRERAYLVGVVLRGASEDLVREQMAELAELARTAGAEVVGTDLQRRAEIEPSHFIGAGKVETLREMVLEGAFDMLVCNEDLSPRQ